MQLEHGANIQPKPTLGLKSMPFLNHSEAMAFELFRSRLVHEMAGVRSLGFWRNIVLPACYTEPAILHASMALVHASRWNQGPRGESGLVREDITRLDTVSDYNKAIQHLKAHVAGHDDPSGLRVALIACVLFIALELLTSRLEKAMIHLLEGRKLLLSSAQFVSSTTESAEVETKTLMLASKPQSIEEELVTLFADLDLQSTHFGSGRPQLRLSAHKPIPRTRPEPLFSLAIPSDFSSIQEANQHLVILANKCLQFVGQELDLDRHTLQDKLSNSHRQSLCIGLRNWRRAYDRFYSKASTVDISDLAWGQQSTLMLIQHAWLRVIVPTSFTEVEETDFDSYLYEFTTITDLASRILAEGSFCGRFSMETGVIPPLSWVVFKCRHPQIRRKALHLLEGAGREGLWEPKLVGQIGRELVALEDGIEDLDSHSLLYREASGQEGHWRHSIPLQRRIVGATVRLESAEHLTLCISFERKVWNSDGRSIGNEYIVRRRPYEGLRMPM